MLQEEDFSSPRLKKMEKIGPFQTPPFILTNSMQISFIICIWLRRARNDKFEQAMFYLSHLSRFQQL